MNAHPDSPDRIESAEAKLAAIRDLCRETPIGRWGDYGAPVVFAKDVLNVIEGGVA